MQNLSPSKDGATEEKEITWNVIFTIQGIRCDMTEQKQEFRSIAVPVDIQSNNRKIQFKETYEPKPRTCP